MLGDWYIDEEGYPSHGSCYGYVVRTPNRYGKLSKWYCETCLEEAPEEVQDTFLFDKVKNNAAYNSFYGMVIRYPIRHYNPIVFYSQDFYYVAG